MAGSPCTGVCYNRDRTPQSKPVSYTNSMSYGTAGWGGRIRTSVWSNQNPPGFTMISTDFLTKQQILPLDKPIG